MAFYSSRFFKTATVGERKAKAAKALERLGKKGGLQPISVQGPLAVTWWGKAWNRNLESYADYSSRIERGRSYARSGSVIDLRVGAGSVQALVQGSRAQPYKINIDIATLYAPSRKRLAEACAGKLESAEALLAGRFPEDLQGILVSEASGLFPNPSQIKFTCNCPDWASMCKHIAATLYGVGVRFDQDPSLFFLLRGIQVEDLVGDVVRKNVDQLLKPRGRGESDRLDMDDSGLGALFGLELESAEFEGGRVDAEKPVKPKPRVKPVAMPSRKPEPGIAVGPAPKAKRGRPKKPAAEIADLDLQMVDESRGQLRKLSQVMAELVKDLRQVGVGKAKPRLKSRAKFR